MSQIINVADLPDLVTVRETLAVLRIGRTKAYELVNAGALEVVKFGKRSTRVKRSSIEKLMANGIA
jgi:excisionase family DNA binding protein